MTVTVLVVATALSAVAPATGAVADRSPAVVPAPTPQWRIQPTPLPDYGDEGWQYGEFDAVACPTTSSCLALGGGVYQAPEVLGGWWDGKSWYIDGTSISGLEDNQGISPAAISCVSVKRCFAIVDAADIDTEIAGYAVWNGRHWSETYDLPGESHGDELNGISCPSRRFCMAVGEIGGHTLFTLAYNGHSWRKVPAAKSQAQQFNGVACPAANACFAVGPSPGKGQLGLIERWNGSTWRAQRVPVAPRARSISLLDVSCSSQTACVAVGSYNDRVKKSHVLALGWNGHGWRRLRFVNTAGDLVSVSCVATGSCVAVGSLSRRPVARVWNGMSWTLQHLPDPGFAGLYSVSCATATYCMTVGSMPGGTAPVAISYF